MCRSARGAKGRSGSRRGPRLGRPGGWRGAGRCRGRRSRTSPASCGCRPRGGGRRPATGARPGPCGRSAGGWRWRSASRSAPPRTRCGGSGTRGSPAGLRRGAALRGWLAATATRLGPARDRPSGAHRRAAGARRRRPPGGRGGLRPPCAVPQGDAGLAGAGIERSPRSGGGEAPGRSGGAPRRGAPTTQTSVPLRPLLQPRAPGRELRTGGLVGRPRRGISRRTPSPATAGKSAASGSWRIPQANRDPRRLGPAGEDEEGGDLRDPRSAELPGPGVEEGEAGGAGGWRRHRSEQGGEPFEERHERRGDLGRQRLQIRHPYRRQAGCLHDLQIPPPEPPRSGRLPREIKNNRSSEKTSYSKGAAGWRSRDGGFQEFLPATPPPPRRPASPWPSPTTNARPRRGRSPARRRLGPAAGRSTRLRASHSDFTLPSQSKPR